MVPARDARLGRQPSTALTTSLLRGRWLYLSLGAAVVALYAWLFTSGALARFRPFEPGSSDTVASSTDQFWNQELDPRSTLEILQRKPQLVLWLGLWTTLTTGLCVTGLALSVRAVWRRQLGRLFRHHAPRPPAWSLGELGRIVLLLALVAGLLPLVRLSLMSWSVPRLADQRLWGVYSMFVLDGWLVLLVWGFAQTKARPPSTALGLSWRTSGRAIAQGLSGYVGLFPWIFGLLWLIVSIAHQLGIQPPIEPIHELLFLERRTVTVVLTVILACVVGPVAEEVFFRGVLFAALRRHTSRLIAMLASGALFAAVHTNPIGFVPILVLGCLLADLYERSGSLLSPIAVHMVHNTFLVGVGLTAKALLG